MEDNEQVESQDLETETTDEEAVEDTSDESSDDEQLSPEQIKELKEKAAKADELEKKNKQLFARVKKGEQSSPVDGLTPLDALTLAKSNVHEDDLETVTKWAKFNGVSVSEALKDRDLKAILDTHDEERRTSQATTTRSGRGSSKASGDDLLTRAMSTGELPDDDEGMAKLVAARQARLLKKKEIRR